MKTFSKDRIVQGDLVNFMKAPRLRRATPGVFVLPQLLTEIDIQKLTALQETPVACGPGTGDDDWSGYYEEEERKRLEKEKREKEEREKKEKEEKEGDGKTEDEKPNDPHVRPEDSLHLPRISRLIWEYVSDVRLEIFPGTLRSFYVEANMKLHKIGVGESVSPHTDENLLGESQSISLCSILLYLNDDYTGGETVFNGSVIAQDVRVGGGLLFRHDILHEGWPVSSGEKCVLKTDLFFRV